MKRILLTAVVAAVAAGCGRTGFESVCAIENCGGHGACTEGDEGASCVCDPGYENDGPMQCAPAEICLEDAGDGVCAGVSNIPSDLARKIYAPDLGELSLEGYISPISLNTDTGLIEDAGGNALRPAGNGMGSGLLFVSAYQTGITSVGATFILTSALSIPADVTLVATGDRPLIILVRDDVEIAGTIDVGARAEASPHPSDGHPLAGPGGFAGGDAGTTGEGAGGGGAGDGDDCGQYSAAGGGGAGHGAPGGRGGDAASPPSCPTVYDGGAAGSSNGSPDLRPLVGGSGGGRGGLPGTAPGVPGRGGGGGGAVQITALQQIRVTGTGVITAPGGGGGGGSQPGGGGGGGGAGGAILLEARDIYLESGSILAANGGGGGSGDCT